MRFSIIITGYNCESYVQRCLDSVNAQTFKDFEVLVHDDCSTDQTNEITAKYDYDRYTSIVNSGALRARYYGVRNAKGEIVLFLGMDDELTPDCLEVLDKVYTDNIKMAYGSWISTDGRGNLAREYPQEVFDNKSFRTHEWLATAPNSFRRELLLSVPEEKLLKDGEFMTNCTDLAYSFPCLEQCKKEEVAVVKKFIYIYRYNHKNTALNRLGKEHKTETRNYLKTIKPL